MYQSWRHLLFLHWKVEPATIQSMLPSGLSVDLFDGNAYVGIVPFFMCGVRPRFLPGVPGLSNFFELNVRTYVHDSAGVPGVWFFSLDANCSPAVWAAQTFFKLPYRHAKMHAKVSDDGWVDYASDCPSGNYDGKFRYRRTSASRNADPDTLEFFLLERYHLYAHDQKRNRLLRGQVSHTPYEFSEAEVPAHDLEPMLGQGINPFSQGYDHACCAKDVDVKILGLERL